MISFHARPAKFATGLRPFPCRPTCEFATLLDKYKPEICGRCWPTEFKKRVARERGWVESVAHTLTFDQFTTILCDACGDETARPRDGFCKRCGARGDGATVKQYVSYQTTEAARMTRNGEWSRPPKKSAEPKREATQPVEQPTFGFYEPPPRAPRRGSKARLPVG